MIIKTIIIWLIKLGVALTSFLPVHTPWSLPDLAPFFGMFAFASGMDRWVSLTALFLTTGIIVLIEGAAGLFAIYRWGVKFIPLPG